MYPVPIRKHMAQLQQRGTLTSVVDLFVTQEQITRAVSPRVGITDCPTCGFCLLRLLPTPKPASNYASASASAVLPVYHGHTHGQARRSPTKRVHRAISFATARPSISYCITRPITILRGGKTSAASLINKSGDSAIRKTEFREHGGR